MNVCVIYCASSLRIMMSIPGDLKLLSCCSTYNGQVLQHSRSDAALFRNNAAASGLWPQPHIVCSCQPHLNRPSGSGGEGSRSITGAWRRRLRALVDNKRCMRTPDYIGGAPERRGVKCVHSDLTRSALLGIQYIGSLGQAIPYCCLLLLATTTTFRLLKVRRWCAEGSQNCQSRYQGATSPRSRHMQSIRIIYKVLQILAEGGG